MDMADPSGEPGHGVTIVPVMKRVDATTTNELEQKVRAVLATGASRIVFDFDDTDYINSTGLRILLSTAKTLAGSGGKMAVAGLKPRVAEVFATAGFDRIFAIHPRWEDAMKALSSST
jgi:anti-sigma B factor antagonist